MNVINSQVLQITSSTQIAHSIKSMAPFTLKLYYSNPMKEIDYLYNHENIQSMQFTSKSRLQLIIIATHLVIPLFHAYMHILQQLCMVTMHELKCINLILCTGLSYYTYSVYETQVTKRFYFNWIVFTVYSLPIIHNTHTYSPSSVSVQDLPFLYTMCLWTHTANDHPSTGNSLSNSRKYGGKVIATTKLVSYIACERRPLWYTSSHKEAQGCNGTLLWNCINQGETRKDNIY